VAYDEALADRVHAHTSQPMMGERPMKGMVVVAPEGVEADEQLGAWVGRGSDVARRLPPK
jgi:hypothetical protein